MYEHFENIKLLYGDAYVQMPNEIFRDLSSSINKNIQQVAFAYSYLTVVSMLYKYAHFVDVDNGTYIQNADIKELLGYTRITKTIDPIIKKGGVLDSIGLTETIKNYPVRFMHNPTEQINNVPIREFVTINDIDNLDINYSAIKGIVKNRNYTVKEPTFFFNYKDDNGTLYDYSNTFRITIDELMQFIFADDFNNIDFLLYGYFKSQCKGLKDDSKGIALNIIVSTLGIGKDAFYEHLNVLKGKGAIDVIHKGWTPNGKSAESNEYFFKGVD